MQQYKQCKILPLCESKSKKTEELYWKRNVSLGSSERKKRISVKDAENVSRPLRTFAEVPYMKLSLSKLRFKEDIDILALTAFVGSALSLLWQAFDYLRGPEIEIVKLDQIVFFEEELRSGDANILKAVKIAAPISMYNLGAPNFDDVVLAESMTVTLESCSIGYWPLNFVRLTKEPDGNLRIKYDRDWGAFSVKYGEALSHSVEFTPLSTELSAVDARCITLDGFLEDSNSANKISIELEMSTAYGRTPRATCEISSLQSLNQSLSSEGVTVQSCR